MISEENFLDFACPYCEETVSFPQEHAGLLEGCPSCAEAFITPPPGTPAARKIPLPWKTQRLIIRRFGPADWKDLLALQSEEELWAYTPGGFMDEAAVLSWLERDPYVKFTSAGQTVYLGLELQEDKKLIGYFSLDLGSSRQASFILWIGRAFQKQGFGLEASDALLEFCFEGLNLHRVVASCDSRNEAGRRLFEKLGLRKEGEFVKDRFSHGEWANTLWYAALQEEYSEKGAAGS